MESQGSNKKRSIQPVVTIRSMYEKHTDFAYWQSQPYEARITALEDTRTIYFARDAKDGYIALSPDFKDFIQALNDEKVRYLVVGGYAVAIHGYPRFTKDIDIWIDRSPENAQRIVEALGQFGFASLGLKAEDFLGEYQFIQLGYPPNRIDIITSLEGVEFSTAYENRLHLSIKEIEVDFLGLDDLRSTKRASGRPQDLIDLDNLQ